MKYWKILPGAVLALALILGTSTLAHADSALGPRLGVSDPDDAFFLGLQGEFGPVLGPATLTTILDFTSGDHSSTLLGVDLRWYLFPLPETGIRLYCGAGPAFLLSPDTELGVNLTLGLHVPMKNKRRYNFEYRWGLGDVPEHKIAAVVMFGL